MINRIPMEIHAEFKLLFNIVVLLHFFKSSGNPFYQVFNHFPTELYGRSDITLFFVKRSTLLFYDFFLDITISLCELTIF